MDTLTATFLACLPKRYRGRFTPYEIPASGAICGGALEALVSLGLLIYRYFGFMNERMAMVPDAALAKAGEKGGESLIMALGPIFLLEYFLHFTTMVLTFFMLEGLVRLAAGVISGEALPSLPLQLAALVHTQLDARQQEKSMGERISDDVQSTAEGSLQISTCRPKPWTKLTTISYEGELYEVVGEKSGAAPRPYIYLLRKKPPTAVIRGIHAYSPDEVLLPTRAQ